VKRCTYWQKKLRIWDWTVALRICAEKELEMGGAAEISISEQSGVAYISILDPKYFPVGAIKQDMEVALVHELVHLRFFPDVRFKLEEVIANNLMEQAVERTAQALVELRRKGDDRDILKEDEVAC